MTQEEKEEKQRSNEPKLSFVTLEDDNLTMLLNAEPKYSVTLPVSISKKNGADKQKEVEARILDGCNNYGIDYVSEENIRNRAKEIVDQLYERARVTKNYVPPPSHPSILEKYGNDHFEFLIDCIKSTVKEENALIRQIMYTKLSAYGNDPINLGVLAPTSTGKTYPITESAKYTPLGKEVRIVGSMTPKVLVREQGVLVDKEGNPISKEVRRLKNAIAAAKKSKSKNSASAVEEYQDELAILLENSAYILVMSNKTLIFLEPPHPELWALIKPILSHDAWEIEHPFVDKVANGMEVKRVITRGWPACIFCSAKDESKWEMWPEIESRFMIVSPNMVRPKYQAGNKLIAQKKGLPHGVKQQIIISDLAKELGKKCFLYLKHQIQQLTSTTDSPVWIPYGERIAEILPADRGQDNRAANRFFTILNMVALSKAHLRSKLIFDNEELVIATLQDLRETLHVMQNITGIPPHKLKFYQQYILPLYNSRKIALKSRDICDFFNINAPKGTPKINTDLVTKVYLEELVNSSYLERQPDPDNPRVYVYTPLMDAATIPTEEGDENDQVGTASNRSNPSNLGRFDQFLQYSKLLLPENHTGIPDEWLKDDILQLSKHRTTSTPLKILDPKGNEISVDDFIKSYESEKGLKLKDFVKVPVCFDGPNSKEFTTPGAHDEVSNKDITTYYDKSHENSSNQPKFDSLDASEVISKAMLDEHGTDKGYFTKDEWKTRLMLLPRQHSLFSNEDQAEQVLYILLQEGRLTEIESSKFKPTEEGRGAD